MTATSAPTPVSGRPRPALSWSRLLWGLALLCAGALWLLDAAGVAAVSYPIAIAIGLIVVGVVVPFVPAHEHDGIIGLGVVLAALALIDVVAGPAANLTVLRHGAGDVHAAPATVEQLERRYEHGVGDLTVDLRGVAFPPGTTRTSVNLGMGDVRVHVPGDVTVRVDANAGVGDVVVLGEQRSGVAPAFDSEVRGRSTERVLDLEASVGFGRIEVTR